LQTGGIGGQTHEGVATTTECGRTTIELLRTRGKVDQVIGHRITVRAHCVVRKHGDTDCHGDTYHDNTEDDEQKLLLSHGMTPLCVLVVMMNCCASASFVDQH
jgi:hypothetical protein